MFQECPRIFAAKSFPPLIQVALIAYPWMILELRGPRYESVLSCKPRFDWFVLMINFYQPALEVSQCVCVLFLPKFYSSEKCHVYPVFFFFPCHGISLLLTVPIRHQLRGLLTINSLNSLLCLFFSFFLNAIFFIKQVEKYLLIQKTQKGNKTGKA